MQVFDLSTPGGVVDWLEVFEDGSFGAASIPNELTSGLANWTWRIVLRQPILRHGKTHNSVIVKHAGSVLNRLPFEFPAPRSKFEYTIMTALMNVPDVETFTNGVRVSTPATLGIDEINTCFLMEDLGDLPTLQRVLRNFPSYPFRSSDACDRIGFALGEYLARFQSWSSSLETAPLRRLFASNPAGTEFRRVLFEKFVEPLAKKGKYGMYQHDVDEIARWYLEHRSPEDLARDGICIEMGDFRTGNMVIDLCSPDDIKIWVLDWECCKTGERTIDAALFQGEGRCVQELWNEVNGQVLLSSFVQGYEMTSELEIGDPLGKVAREAALMTLVMIPSVFASSLAGKSSHAAERLKVEAIEALTSQR